MVNKITVIALVLIVAAPILIGYAMAYKEVEKTGWSEGAETNVTELLNNEIAWSYVDSNPYSMNTRNIYDFSFESGPAYPYYNKIQSTPLTTLPMSRATLAANTQYNIDSFGTAFWESGTRDVQINYINASMVATTVSITDVASVEWGGFTQGGNSPTISGTYLDEDNELQTFKYYQAKWINFSDDVTIEAATGNTYADLSYGWRVMTSTAYDNYTVPVWSVGGYETDSVIFTMDLGGTDPYDFEIIYPDGSYTTVSMIYNGTNLYINGTKVPCVANGATLAASGNVWQIVLTPDGILLNYVKFWPDQFSIAKAYYSKEISARYSSNNTYKGISLQEGITYRADRANVRSMHYPVIEDNTYDPLSILMDDSASYRIQLSNLDQIGSSITWGGETYTVTDGSITLHNKKIKLDKLELDSVYLDGVRSNRINGTEISTGSNTITFNGTWSIVVKQTPLNYETWTATEWQPGEFAWNGVDQSFALMGLITCAAAFVGLGMYGKRSGAKVGTLMLVCGAAAFVFLALL